MRNVNWRKAEKLKIIVVKYEKAVSTASIL